MFNVLRKQFIVTTMSIVSVVLVVVFSIIYFSAAHSFNRKPEPPFSTPNVVRSEHFDQDTRTYIEAQRKAVADRSLRDLLIVLVIAGFVTLGAVYMVSRYVANRAVRAIEDAYLKQRQFIADASHELKTPITIISANTDAAISDTVSPSKWLSNIRKESDRMGKLVTDLLLLARFDSDTTTVTSSTFDVSEVILPIIKSFEPIVKKRKIFVAKKLTAQLYATSDKDKVQQLLTILIDNAVKYTQSGGKITINSRGTDSTVTITIANTHPHVNDEELGKFFDRFYQKDPSHRSEGHGLGLAIARDVAAQLKSKLSVSSTKDRVEFSLELSNLR